MKAWMFFCLLSSSYLCVAQDFAPDSVRNRKKITPVFNEIVGVGVFHENDMLNFFARNADDNYTGGLHLRLNTISGFNELIRPVTCTGKLEIALPRHLLRTTI
ncbi:hypothetical protein FAZ15_01265 [Sphingobacterium olei]|uniref:Uncharacterized protein n=1 Tax=Sphingobacterium olei TaxID=2571155 RepID=A0A4U0P6J4_9SPHI|nr:hypothetical protein [Sphingobacterium olei]TJZ62959.1 hypothetical protein FAZ15_01265 [Sphingobacterium olei]